MFRLSLVVCWALLLISGVSVAQAGIIVKVDDLLLPAGSTGYVPVEIIGDATGANLQSTREPSSAVLKPAPATSFPATREAGSQFRSAGIYQAPSRSREILSARTLPGARRWSMAATVSTSSPGPAKTTSLED